MDAFNTYDDFFFFFFFFLIGVNFKIEGSDTVGVRCAI